MATLTDCADELSRVVARAHLLELALCGDGGGLSFDSKLYRTALARQATDIADGLVALEEALEVA